MVSTDVLFTLVVCKVFLPWVVFEVKFTLFDRICHPKESHFHLARLLLFHGVVCDAHRGGVIAVYERGGLWVSHLL